MVLLLVGVQLIAFVNQSLVQLLRNDPKLKRKMKKMLKIFQSIVLKAIIQKQ